VRRDKYHENYFLYIDGALNLDKYFDKLSNLDIQGIDIEKIKEITETGEKVVLSSLWR